MRKILVPVDFSEFSSYALEVAAHFAKSYKAEILVLHMIGLSEAYLTKSPSEEAAEAHYYMKLAKKHFDELLDKPFLKGIRVVEMVQNYKIFSEINALAIEKEVDLIVMGSHGKSGLGEFFVGSNTEKVVRTSEIPVLVIKKPHREYHPQLVVFACDFEIENLKAYQKATALFKEWQADVHLVYVNLPNEQFKSSQEIKDKIDFFLKVAHHNQLPSNQQLVILSDYSIEAGIFSYAEELNANLIAVITHGRSGIAHFFKGSIGEAMANHANRPVITFKP